VESPQVLKLVRAVTGPHARQRVLHAGAAIPDARAAVVCVHGRGGNAADILGLRAELPDPNVAFVAPQAAGDTWYPSRFIAPLADNEPFLSSALDLLDATIETLESHGLTRRHIVLLGFSQGGCLAIHFGALRATRWGGLVGLSAGLIGPPGITWRFEGSLDGAPVFLGCSDHDPHIPDDRLRESARVLEALGGEVALQVYPGLGHTINADELTEVRRIVKAAAKDPR
jgi:predicted esterase